MKRTTPRKRPVTQVHKLRVVLDVTTWPRRGGGFGANVIAEMPFNVDGKTRRAALADLKRRLEREGA